MKLKKSELQKMINEAVLAEAAGGYVESMGPDFDKGIKLVVKGWKQWVSGPMTEKGDIKPAREDVVEYLEGLLK